MKLISSRKTLVTRWYTFEFCCHLHFSVPRLVNMDRRCSENDCGEVDMKVTAELSEGLKIKEEEQAICAVPWHIPISFHVCPLECSEDDEDSVQLFHESLLDRVKKEANIPDPPAGFRVRPLCLGDYKYNYLNLLSQLTEVGYIHPSLFKHRFNTLRNTSPQSYYIVVIDIPSTREVIASTTLFLEWKFIHEAGCRGRTEDVVVDNRYRGMQLGKILNFYIVALARHFGCYKLSLECRDALVNYYGKFGYQKDDQYFMTQRLRSANLHPVDE